MNRLYLDSLGHGFLPHTPPEKLCVVGDVHNNLGTFLGIARDFLAKNTGGRVIQLGDFCGDRMHFRDFLTGMIHREEMEKIHIVKGNHDSGMPTGHPMSLQDIGESDDGDILTIRGAATPAIARIQGRSYYGEELNEYQFNEILTLIRQRVKRPRVIITHDGPQSVTDIMWPKKKIEHSLTSRCLQKVLDTVTTLVPHELGTTWIFGHHHEHQEEIQGIDFRAIGELETLII